MFQCKHEPGFLLKTKGLLQILDEKGELECMVDSCAKCKVLYVRDPTQHEVREHLKVKVEVALAEEELKRILGNRILDMERQKATIN